MTRAAIVFVLFVLVQIIGSAVALLCGNADHIGQGTPLMEMPVRPEAAGVSLLVFETLLTAGLVWYYRWADPPRRKAAPTGLQLLVAAGGTAVLSVGLSLLLQPLALDDRGATLLFEGMRHNVLCLALLCLVGPVCEELVFRRGVLQGLIAGGWSVRWALPVSAAAFALVHGNLGQMIPAFLIGLLLGWCYLRTGRLRLSVAAHVANNTLGVVLMSVPQAEALTANWGTEACIAAGLPLAAAGTVLVLRSLKRA